MSVIMSRPTTLRAAIEKVSIESLISDEFRQDAGAQAGEVPESGSGDAGPREDQPAASAPATGGAPPPAVPAGADATTGGPHIPFFDAMPAAPAATPSDAVADRSSQEVPAPAPGQAPAGHGPEGVPPDPTAPHDLDEGPGHEPESTARPDTPAERPSSRAAASGRVLRFPSPTPLGEGEGEGEDSAVGRVDPDAFARATEDFMRTSPVMGARGRRVQRPSDDTGFNDPDAIAVSSMTQDLGRMGVPSGRHAETRARLSDLARRIERGELDWTSLRKAVWFAMEYPELARRLMPVLLPWIDRAA